MYRVRDGIVLRDVGGIFFLVDIKAPDYFERRKLYSINEFGKNIFEIMSETIYFDADTIFSTLKTKYEIDSTLVNTLKQDINSFVKKLYALGYIGDY